MKDSDCVCFLQWALPRLRLQWPGYRKVRGQVCKRIGRRMQELGIPAVADYRKFLEQSPGEWAFLDRLCPVTVSRFYRDRGVFAVLEQELFPELAQLASRRRERLLRAWSAGCACGEEPYTLRILWDLRFTMRFPELAFALVATDVNPDVLARARAGCYSASNLRALPDDWLTTAFTPCDGLYRIRDEHRKNTEFVQQDLRRQLPGGSFHLILCRNLAFTYFDQALQREIVAKLFGKLIAGGFLMIGIHELLPAGAAGLEPWNSRLGIYRKD